MSNNVCNINFSDRGKKSCMNLKKLFVHKRLGIINFVSKV